MKNIKKKVKSCWTCEKMMGKREKEADSIELEQPEGVPKVKEISKEI